MKRWRAVVGCAATVMLLAQGLIGCSRAIPDPAPVPQRRLPPDWASPTLPSQTDVRAGGLEIRGYQFVDNNANGRLDVGDRPLPNWPMRLYAYQDGDKLDWSHALATVQTDQHGQFAFTGLKPGRYLVVAAATSQSGTVYEQSGLANQAHAQPVRLRALRSIASLQASARDFQPLGYQVDLTQPAAPSLPFVVHPSRAPMPVLRLPAFGSGRGSAPDAMLQFLGAAMDISGLANHVDHNALVVGANEELLVVSNQWSVGDSDLKIYGQRLARSLARKGPQFLASDLGDGVAVCYNPERQEYLLAWESHEDPTHIRGQRFSSDGQPINQPILIASLDGRQDNPSIAFDDNTKQYLVTWDDQRTGTDQVRIFGQFVAGDGQLVGPNLQIATHGVNNFAPIAVYNSKRDEFLVAWNDRRTTWQIFGQRVGGKGELLGDELAIANEDHNQQFPHMAYNPEGDQYLIVWEDDRNKNSSLFDIFGQLVAGKGELKGRPIAISTAPGDQLAPVVAADSARGDFLVAFEDNRNSAVTGSDIFGQVVANNGSLKGDNFAINADPLDQTSPYIAFIPDKLQFVVSWTHEEPFQEHLRAQKLH